jgi:hypothetical protein
MEDCANGQMEPCSAPGFPSSAIKIHPSICVLAFFKERRAESVGRPELLLKGETLSFSFSLFMVTALPRW